MDLYYSNQEKSKIGQILKLNHRSQWLITTCDQLGHENGLKMLSEIEIINSKIVIG